MVLVMNFDFKISDMLVCYFVEPISLIKCMYLFDLSVYNLVDNTT